MGARAGASQPRDLGQVLLPPGRCNTVPHLNRSWRARQPPCRAPVAAPSSAGAARGPEASLER